MTSILQPMVNNLKVSNFLMRIRSIGSSRKFWKFIRRLEFWKGIKVQRRNILVNQLRSWSDTSQRSFQTNVELKAILVNISDQVANPQMMDPILKLILKSYLIWQLAMYSPCLLPKVLAKVLHALLSTTTAWKIRRKMKKRIHLINMVNFQIWTHNH